MSSVMAIRSVVEVLFGCRACFTNFKVDRANLVGIKAIVETRPKPWARTFRVS